MEDENNWDHSSKLIRGGIQRELFRIAKFGGIARG